MRDACYQTLPRNNLQLRFSLCQLSAWQKINIKLWSDIVKSEVYKESEIITSYLKK